MSKETKLWLELFILGGVLMYVPYWPFPAAGFILWGIAVVRVWWVERKGKFDFIAKWVRPDKQDGKYLSDITGHAEIWHWRPW
jgi:hypothetical protein